MDQPKSTRFVMRISPVDLRRIKQAADRNHLSATSWARKVLMDALQHSETNQ